ncbi:hypothetical protein KJ632_05800, partial [Patescibacteria group bacterium]|nr:hypothetical protein [Patescibacteria group bacterium]
MTKNRKAAFKKFHRRKKEVAKEKGYKVENYFFKSYLEEGEQIKYVVHVSPLMYHIDFSKIKIINFLIPAIVWFIFPFLKLLCIGMMIWGLLRIMDLVWTWYYDCWLVTN